MELNNINLIKEAILSIVFLTLGYSCLKIKHLCSSIKSRECIINNINTLMTEENMSIGFLKQYFDPYVTSDMPNDIEIEEKKIKEQINLQLINQIKELKKQKEEIENNFKSIKSDEKRIKESGGEDLTAEIKSTERALLEKHILPNINYSNKNQKSKNVFDFIKKTLNEKREKKIGLTGLLGQV